MTTKPRKTTTKPAIKASSGGRLIKLLMTRSGHDISALSGKLGWQPHTTRAALSRLRKAGYAIEKLPPGKHGGARYRLSSAPAGPAR